MDELAILKLRFQTSKEAKNVQIAIKISIFVMWAFSFFCLLLRLRIYPRIITTHSKKYSLLCWLKVLCYIWYFSTVLTYTYSFLITFFLHRTVTVVLYSKARPHWILPPFTVTFLTFSNLNLRLHLIFVLQGFREIVDKSENWKTNLTSI